MHERLVLNVVLRRNVVTCADIVLKQVSVIFILSTNYVSVLLTQPQVSKTVGGKFWSLIFWLYELTLCICHTVFTD